MWPGLDLLWDETLGDPNICIAVLDGPVDQSHPCFDGAQLIQLETLASGTSSEEAASKHGTFVTSVIFGQHGSPVQGIAPGCRGLIVPVFTEREDGSLASCSQLDLARAITQAVDHGAHVINISGGELTPSGEPDPLLAQAIRLCADNNVLVVAAAGNNGCQCLHVPAAVPSVLAVGAMDAQGSPMTFSNWGAAYQVQGILAPGENILGAVPGGGTAAQSSTSGATPVISGIVGLLLSIQFARGVKPDPYAVRAALLQSAHPCDHQRVSTCERFLAGSLNIAGAHTLITKGGEKQVNQNPEKPKSRVAASGGSIQTIELPTTTDMQVASVMASGLETAVPQVSTTVTGESSENPVRIESQKLAKERKVKMSEQQQVEIQPEVDTNISLVDSINEPMVTPSEVYPASRGGDSEVRASADGGGPTLVYALGVIGYDFGMEARRDAFVQAMGEGKNPDNPVDFLAHLEEQPYQAADVIWTLNLDATPIYAIRPVGSFSGVAYERLREFLNGQLTEGVTRVSIPGIVAGKVRLLSTQEVPVIVPVLRGMYSWSTEALVSAALGTPPEEEEEKVAYGKKLEGIHNFLERVYYELRNLGLSAQERALNFAATNAFQVAQVFHTALGEEMELDTITAEPSSICRPGSECWDVKLTFFNPSQRLDVARKVYRFTIDVSDVVPVSVGVVRSWSVY